MRGNPPRDIRHHLFLANVIQQVVVVPLVEFERLVCRARVFVKKLAPARLCRLICSSVENEQRQSDPAEPSLEPFVGTHQLSNRPRWLRFMSDERILIHSFDRLWVARKILVLEMKHMRKG